MPKSPSNIAVLATNYFLTVGTVRNSVAGAAIINTVRTAALASGTVTDAQYDQYTQYTAWRWQSFVQHNALTT